MSNETIAVGAPRPTNEPTGEGGGANPLASVENEPNVAPCHPPRADYSSRPDAAVRLDPLSPAASGGRARLLAAAGARLPADGTAQARVHRRRLDPPAARSRPVDRWRA